MTHQPSAVRNEIGKFIHRFKSSSFLRNWTVLSGTNIGVQVLTVLSSMRIARALTPSGYGEYNIVFVQAGFFGILAALGFRQIIVRMVARNDYSPMQLFGTSLIIRLGSFVIAAFLLYLYNMFIDHTLIPFYLVLCIGNIAFNSLNDLIEMIAFGKEKMELSGWLSLIFTVIWVAAVFLVPKSIITVHFVAALTVWLLFFRTLMYFIISKYNGYFTGTFRLKGSYALGKEIVIQSMSYFWIALLTMGMNQLPILMLNKRSGTAEVGFFNIAYRILSPLQLILANALNALYPKMAKFAFAQPARFLSLLKKAGTGLTMLGIFGSLFVSSFRWEIVNILYGSAYRESIDIISVQCWYTVFFALVWLVGVVFGSLDKQRALSALVTITTFIAVPLLWVGAGYGANGLSIAFVVAGLIKMFIHWVWLQRILPERLSAWYSWGIFLALGLGFAVSVSLTEQIPLYVRSSIFLAAFPILFYCYKYFLRDVPVPQVAEAG